MSILEEMRQEWAEIKTFMTDKVSEGVTPLREEIDRLVKGYEAMQSKVADFERQKLAAMDSLGRHVVRDGRLAGMDAFSLRILDRVLANRRQAGHSLPNLEQDVATARTAMFQSITPDTFLGWEDAAMRRIKAKTNEQSTWALFQTPVSQWTRDMIGAHKRALDSTTAAIGDELVPTFEAAELWMDVNLETLILPLLPQSPMPTNPFDIPTQLGDTNWYPITENVSALTTDVATAKVTLTAQGLKTGVPFSDELEEDAIISLVAEIRSSLVRNASEVIDDVLLNADQTTANGINSDGATIAKTTAGKAHWLLGFDGIIHLPLVDNTAQGNAHSATLTSADAFNEIHARLGKYGVPRRRGEVVFASDVNTAIRAMSIDEVETVDKAGGRATISSGELAQIYGTPYIRSEQIKLADTDGKVTDSGGNTTGRILALNTTQWRVGFRRQIEVETEREAGKGQTTMYVSFRIALTERSGSRGGATHTALQYDISGVA